MPDATAVDGLGDDWMHAPPDSWTGRLDFGWMARLREHDFWDLDQNGLRPDAGLFLESEPDIRDLFAWSKLRIAKGVHDRAVGSALRDVEELARLCFTTERLGTERAGLAILTLVRRARDRLGITTPAGSVDAETSRRIQRALFGANAFARLETPAAYEEDFSRIVVGRCTALHDGVMMALLLRADLRDARPADYLRMERLMAAAPDCRIARLRDLWALPDDEKLTKPELWSDRVMMRWIPGSRRLWGEVLLAIGQQDWFKQYEQREP